jgi:short-subunit dehydrogenase
LNAGFGQIGAFTEITDMDVHKQVTVNAVHPIYTAKVMVD